MASEKPVVLITGANTGLGFEIVKALLRDSEYEILLGSRSLDKADEAIASIKDLTSTSKSSITPIQIDVSSDESINKAYEVVSTKFGRLDVLVNNAGTSLDYAALLGKMELRDAFNQMWDVNVTGAHVTTMTFVPLLLKAAHPRILFLTSGASSLAETEILDGWQARVNAAPPAGWPKPVGASVGLGYRSTKTGLNMVGKQWERILKNDGVKVFVVSPGFLATNLGGAGSEVLRKMGAIDPQIGGEFVRDVVVGRRDDQAGKVIRQDEIQAW